PIGNRYATLPAGWGRWPAHHAAAGDHFHQRNDSAAWAQALENAAPIRVRCCRRRGITLLHAGESGYNASATLCCYLERSFRLSSNRALLPTQVRFVQGPHRGDSAPARGSETRPMDWILTSGKDFPGNA